MEVGKKIIEENWIPYIKISNTEGNNLEVFKQFLNILPIPYEITE
jgi:hypothetical protein